MGCSDASDIEVEDATEDVRDERETVLLLWGVEDDGEAVEAAEAFPP